MRECSSSSDNNEHSYSNKCVVQIEHSPVTRDEIQNLSQPSAFNKKASYQTFDFSSLQKNDFPQECVRTTD
jgi:hypothetical protein